MSPQEHITIARQLYGHREFDKALDCLAKVPADYQWSSAELVMKARLIQLSDDTQGFTLDDAATCLREAVMKEPSNPTWLMELAFFESRVQSLSEQGEIKFAQAAGMLAKQLGECLGGLLEARDIDVKDPRSRQALAKFLQEAEETAMTELKHTFAL